MGGKKATTLKLDVSKPPGI